MQELWPAKEFGHDLGLVSPPGSAERFSRGRFGCVWCPQSQTTFTDASDAGNLGKSRHVSCHPHPCAARTGRPVGYCYGRGGEFSVWYWVIQRQSVSHGADESALVGGH